MGTNVIMPALGMAQETGKVLRWLKGEGDAVTKGEPLLEIETDKATVELEAPASGILSRVTAAAGDVVPVGRAIAEILAVGESPGDSRRTAASPKARRLARERGVDLARLSGSGPGGAVLATDIIASPGGQVSAPHAPTPAPSTLSTTWRLMAERTAQSWATVPHFFLLREVDAARLVAWREQSQTRSAVEVTYSDLLVKAVAAALRQHPRLNARWEGGTVVPNDEINVGLAVANDDGLVVPVIHGADRLNLNEIAVRRSEVVARARAGRSRPEDLRGGTFTISNLGMYGVDAFNAIVNAPQAAILAVGRIVERVVPVDGTPGVRPMLMLSLSCDHRVADGARAAQFLTTLAELIEEPVSLVE